MGTGESDHFLRSDFESRYAALKMAVGIIGTSAMNDPARAVAWLDGVQNAVDRLTASLDALEAVILQSLPDEISTDSMPEAADATLSVTESPAQLADNAAVGAIDPNRLTDTAQHPSHQQI